MLPCLRVSSSGATADGLSIPPVSHGHFSDETPVSSFQPSPTVNLTHEYTIAVQTDSYSEIWSKIHNDSHTDDNSVNGHVDLFEEPRLLEQVLHPSHEYVLQALSHITPTALTKLVAEYFEHSERTMQLCLSLHHNLHHARRIYTPLSDLLDILSVDLDGSLLSQAQCDTAFDIFLQFDQFENPFPSPGEYNFNNMRQCFSQLREQLDRRLDKSRSRLHLIRGGTRGAAICLIAAVVGVAISAAVITTHGLVAVFIPLCPVCLPSCMTRKEESRHAQLDAATKGVYILHKDLDTIDRLVARLCAAFESDKLLIRLGLDRGRERHSIQEVLKLLCKTHSSFLQQLTDLDEHLCLCFSAINRARALLLREIVPPS